MKEEDRKDFFFYIDEFHNFSTDSFAGILSEARKYRLCLTLSHQYVEQLKPEVQRAVFGNVGSIISFRVGNADAEVLANEFGNGYTREHFTGLSNHEILVKLGCAGENAVFAGRTFPPIKTKRNRRKKTVQNSRQRFGTLRTLHEPKVRKWMERNF